MEGLHLGDGSRLSHAYIVASPLETARADFVCRGSLLRDGKKTLRRVPGLPESAGRRPSGCAPCAPGIE